MPDLGVSVAVLRAGHVLLTQREDFEVWCLPGGAVDPGESVAQAAVREVREETGLAIRLTRLVGVYSKPYWNQGGLHVILFAAELLSEMITPAVTEVLRVQYFAPDQLPQPILWGHQQQILDAVELRSGVAWSQNGRWPFIPGMPRKELYALRDLSGLSRQQFYLQHVMPSGYADQQLEVGENGANMPVNDE